MEITEVRIKLMEEPGERLKAFCSITFDDCFVVRDLKIIEGASGPFVAMPSRKLTSHCPSCRSKNHLRAVHCNQCGSRLAENQAVKDEEGRAKLYADIAHPINSVCREMIQDRVILSYTDEKENAKIPGYISSYDDFEEAEVIESETPQLEESSPEPTLEPSTPQFTAETTKVDESETPHGPHKVPGQKALRSRRRPTDSFGAGIFE